MGSLKTASLEIRKCAAAVGITSGQWEPIPQDRDVDALPDDAPVARVWNRRGEVTLTAGDLRYAGLYL